MRKKVYNQFRIKEIEKNEIHTEEIIEIAKKYFKVIDQQGERLTVKIGGGLQPSSHWEFFIEERGETFDICLELTREVHSRDIGLLLKPRVLMNYVRKEIDKRTLERRRAFNLERQIQEVVKNAKRIEGAGERRVEEEKEEIEEGLGGMEEGK